MPNLVITSNRMGVGR